MKAVIIFIVTLISFSGKALYAFMQSDSSFSFFLFRYKYVTLLFTGFSLSNKVDQSPADVIQKPGESAKIQCLHGIPRYDQINFYRQNQDHGFTLMGYLLGKEPYEENDFKDQIQISGDGNSNGYLTINSLSPNDSAVYFCAAYYTVF